MFGVSTSTGSSVSGKNLVLSNLSYEKGVGEPELVMPKADVEDLGWAKTVVPSTGELPLDVREKRGVNTWQVIAIVLGVLGLYVFMTKKGWI